MLSQKHGLVCKHGQCARVSRALLVSPLHALLPQVGPDLRTSGPHVYVAGDICAN